MSNRTLFITAILLSGVQSCSRYEFDKNDEALLNAYSVDDTLVFKSNKGNFDTIRITKKETRFNGLSEGYSGNPETCYIYYQMVPPGEMVLVGFGGESGNEYSNEHIFISAVKWKPDQPATINVKFDNVINVKWKPNLGVVFYQKTDSTTWDLIKRY